MRVWLELQRFNFPPQLFIFSHLALQETFGERGFFCHAGGGQQVGVGQFVGVFTEVAHLDPALLCQCLEAEVDAADVDAHFFGQGALRYAGVFLEQLERPKKGVVVCGLAAGGHVALEGLNWK